MNMKKDIHNIFRTTLKLGVILLFVITIFSSTSGVIIDEDLIIEINNETYTFLEEMNFERIVISTEFIILNNTGFNITSTNPSEIQINNIANNTLYPDTVDENLVDFTLLNADAGDIWFNISGFYPETYYEVTTDGVLLEYYQANDTGSVSIFVEGADSKQYNINANATAFNPIVTTTGTATNITNNGAILYANLVYDGGESCDVWIEYGTTESYGIDSTYNATKTTGGEFLYDFNWDLQNPSPLIDLNNVGHDDDDFFQRFECFGNINITYINYSLAKDNDGASYNIEAFVIDSPLGSTSYSETTVSMDDVPESPDTLWFNFKFDPAIQLIDIHEDSNIYGFGVSDDASPFNHLRILSSSNDNYEYGAYYYTDIGDFDYDICFIVNNGTSYRRNLSAGQLYHYRAVAKNTNSTSYGADAAFLTLPNVTRNPVATPRSDTMNLTWINGSGANNTYIERNKTGITSWERGEGTLIYNESGFAFTDLSLELETTYHYQFWSFTNWTDGGTIYNNFSPIYNTTSSTTHIIYPPYNGASSYDTTNLKVNLTWTSGNNSDYDIVIQNNNSYSNSPTDGWVRQNNTSNSSNYFNTTIITNAYFTIWSYNESSDCYSSTGLNIPWGAIALSCYSENNPETALTFDIEISNSSFTVTYAANDLTNPHYLDMEDIPYGVGTIFQVSSDGYETRSFTYDILQNAFYNLTFYLPLSIPSGGTSDPDYDENETYSEDYVIHVVGPQSEYGVDPPIEDAEVIIRKYINTTGQYETVGV